MNQVKHLNTKAMNIANEINEINAQIDALIKRRDYLTSIEVINSLFESAVLIPNSYLQVEYGKEVSLKSVCLDWRNFDSSIATEKSAIKDINEAVKQIKEHYSESSLSWVKPMKDAVKKYFAGK